MREAEALSYFAPYYLELLTAQRPSFNDTRSSGFALQPNIYSFETT